MIKAWKLVVVWSEERLGMYSSLELGMAASVFELRAEERILDIQFNWVGFISDFRVW